MTPTGVHEQQRPQPRRPARPGPLRSWFDSHRERTELRLADLRSDFFWWREARRARSREWRARMADAAARPLRPITEALGHLVRRICEPIVDGISAAWRCVGEWMDRAIFSPLSEVSARCAERFRDLRSAHARRAAPVKKAQPRPFAREPHPMLVRTRHAWVMCGGERLVRALAARGVEPKVQAAVLSLLLACSVLVVRAMSPRAAERVTDEEAALVLGLLKGTKLATPDAAAAKGWVDQMLGAPRGDGK